MLGLTLRACIFIVTFPFLFKRTGGVLNDSVPVGLSCSHGRDVQPSRVFLWSAVIAIVWRSPRLFVDCGKTHPHDQLAAPAAAAYYRPPRDEKSAYAKALVCYTTDYAFRALPTNYGGTACLHVVCP